MSQPDYWVPQPYSISQAAPFQPWSPYPDMGLGMLGQMMLPMAANHLHGQFGTNLGMTYQGNLYNNLQQQAFLTSHNFLVQQAAVNDQVAARDIIRGAGSVMGVQWTPENEQRANAMAQAGTQVLAPLLLQSDMGAQLYNNMLGGRSEAVLAKYMHMAGQFRNDPFSPQSTTSAFSTGELTARLFKDLYGAPGVPGGHDLWRQRMAGLDSYDTGQMIYQMQMRGQLGRNTDFEGLSGDRASDERLLAGRDVEAIKQSLGRRAEAVKAMREIFGDAGNPNAPMQQLMDALESLTGGTQRMTGGPDRLQSLVRNLNNAARDVGVGVNTYGAMVEQTSYRYQAMGIDPTFAPLAVTGQLGMLGALNQASVFDTPSWGLSGPNQLMAQHGARYAGAAQSEVANFFNTVLRLQGNSDAYSIQSNAEGQLAQQLVAEAKNGQYGPASERLRRMQRGERLAFLQSSFGISAGQAVAQLEESTYANQEYGQRYNTAEGITQQAQRRELLETLGTNIASTNAYSELRDYADASGVSISGLDTVSGDMANASMAALGNLDSEDLKSPERRRRAMANAMRQTIATQGGDLARLMRSDPRRADQLLLQMADQQFNIANDEVRRRMGNNTSLPDLLITGAPDVLAANARLTYRRQLRSDLQRDVAGLDENSPLQRFVESLMARGFDPDSGDANKTLASIFGIDNSKAAQAVAVNLGTLVRKEKALHKQLDALDPSDVKARKAVTDQIQAVNEEYHRQMGVLNENKEMKDIYESWQEQLQQEASGSKPTSLTIEVRELNINGTKIQDAKGTSKATAKQAQGRGQGSV